MIGRRVKEIRMQKKLSLSQLAERAEIAKSYLSNLERDICINPTIDVVEKLAKALKVHPAVLLSWEIKELGSGMGDSFSCIKSHISTLDSLQLKELRDSIDIVVWKREKVPLIDLGNLI
ncbi:MULTISPECIES: helix-turn-helix domain-containing protein [Priestia]|uniref:helix-turn-helix domain-containing protein n=1 Tax=Priestia TaxID=2800373 RepID=UPI000BF8D1E9|nr:helix-turn-helix transcriptional regulator [Priestia megaterium]MBZ5479371.1 helix-turn-helix transcriptional regulator [Bacillus sp. T_4]MDN3228370.1 helix-turn-helix transcriptional regulator [Priestia megaterium]PFV95501.1 transcriptional regulator [Priestia megaterium]UYO26372.1 helix-turn-helix domain-containing protein [Bacillus sp. T_4]